MPSRKRLQRVREAVRSSRALLAQGLSARELRASLRDGRRVGLGEGFSVSGQIWRDWYSEERHLARALAISFRSGGNRAIFSHHTAALIHGLLGFDLNDEPVHLVQLTDATPGRRPGVARHRNVIDPADVTLVEGLRCTGLVRTLHDMARFATPEQAIVALDAGLAVLSRAGVNGQASERELYERIQGDGRRGLSGTRQARLLHALADCRADSPVESLSRLQLTRLGFEVASQVEVSGPRQTYYVDFEFLGLNVFGEVDGAVKYRKQEMLRGRTSWEVLRDEKDREDWIRGVTGKRLVRWGFREAVSLSTMRVRLQAFGVAPADGW